MNLFGKRSLRNSNTGVAVPAPGGIDITLTSGRKIHIRALSIEDACDPTIGKGLAKFRTALVKQTANTIRPTLGEIANGGGVYFDVAAILREAGEEGRAAFQAAIDMPLGSIPIANISEVMEAYIKQNVSVDALKQEFKFLFDIFCEAAGVPKKRG